MLIIHKTLLSPYDIALLEIYDYILYEFYMSFYLLYLLISLTQQILPHHFKKYLGNNINEDFEPNL